MKGKSVFLSSAVLLATLALPLAFGQQTAMDFVNSGRAKMITKDYDGAFADFSKAIELDPKYASAYDNRGDIKKGKGDWDGAIDDFSKAIELDPKYASAYYNRGVAKTKKGDLDGAIADYTKAIELHPKITNAYCGRGYAKQGKGDWDGAITDFSKVIELQPLGSEAYTARGNAKNAKGKIAEANADFTQAAKMDRLGVQDGLGEVMHPLVLAGFAMAAIALYLTLRSFLLLLRGEFVQGRVVTRNAQPNFTDGSAVGGPTTYAPLVEFVDSKGIRHQFQSRVGSSRPDTEDGDSVSVVYDPANPEKAEIRSTKALWFAPIVAWILALACLGYFSKR